jgi:hypothetical protein
MKTHTPILAALALASPAHALVLMLDFGPTTVTGTTDQRNSPYHSVAGPGFTDTVWNKIEGAPVADVPSGLLFSDNSAATGVAINFGIGVTSTLVNLATQPTTGTNALGTATNTGVYTGTSVGKDAIFSGTGLEVRNLGVQITGLAAGVYEVFMVTRNTNTNQNYAFTSFAGAGAAGANFDYVNDGGYVSDTLDYVLNQAPASTWIEEGNTNENYVKLTVTLTAGQALNLAVQGDATQTRGFLNAVQVVLIPEPSSALLVMGALVPLALRRKRH